MLISIKLRAFAVKTENMSDNQIRICYPISIVYVCDNHIVSLWFLHLLISTFFHLFSHLMQRHTITLSDFISANKSTIKTFSVNQFCITVTHHKYAQQQYVNWNICGSVFHERSSSLPEWMWKWWFLSQDVTLCESMVFTII